MLNPERDYPIIGGVIAAAMLSVLVFRCRKRDRDAGRRLLILDILVSAHTLEWILIWLVQPFARRAFFVASEGDPIRWFNTAAWLLRMALSFVYLLSVPWYFLFLFFFLRGNDRKKQVLWEGMAIFVFYLLVVVRWLLVNLS